MDRRKFCLRAIIALLLAAPAWCNQLNGQVMDPPSYNYLRSADVMWSKKIWRILDLKQKMNLPFYYPTGIDELEGRVSFINMVLKAWKGDYNSSIEKPLTLYSWDMNTDDFTKLVSATVYEVISKINDDAIDTSISINDPVIDWDLVFQSTFQVTKLLMKEEWYFDKQRAKMEIRIIGICPIIEKIQYDNLTGEVTGVRPFPLFWVNFAEARPVFDLQSAFNPNNDMAYRSYDELFHLRRFESYIIQESNVYNNRPISSYAVGEDALLEAERIKDWLFKFEHDLWEY